MTYAVLERARLFELTDLSLDILAIRGLPRRLLAIGRAPLFFHGFVTLGLSLSASYRCPRRCPCARFFVRVLVQRMGSVTFMITSPRLLVLVEGIHAVSILLSLSPFLCPSLPLLFSSPFAHRHP